MLILILISVAIAIMIDGCGSTQSAGDDSGQFSVASDAFMNGELIPEKYTSRENSFPLAWENQPSGTKSFAIMTVDVHPVANHWIHWAVLNVPAKVNRIPEGASRTDKLPEGSVELLNTSSAIGFDPPSPPFGSGVHEYKTIVYALDVESLESPRYLSYEKFNELIDAHVIASAEISGLYERK